MFSHAEGLGGNHHGLEFAVPGGEDVSFPPGAGRAPFTREINLLPSGKKGAVRATFLLPVSQTPSAQDTQ